MRAIGFVAAALLAVATALPPARAAQPDPRAVNLRLADMPAGFAPKVDQRVTNAEAARGEGVTPAEEVRRGRLTASRVRFAGSGQGALLTVDSTVGLYTTAGAARAEFDRGIRAIRLPKAYRPMALPPAGEKRYAWRATVSATGPIIASIAAFVRGRYIVLLGTATVGAAAGAKALARFAAVVDGRIRHSR